MFVDLYQKKSLTDPTLLQSIAEFQGPLLGHFPLLETMTKWPNGGPWASKVSQANLLEGFGVSAVIVPQVSIMHIVYFNEI